jgi:uncharacterized protein DUF4352
MSLPPDEDRREASLPVEAWMRHSSNALILVLLAIGILFILVLIVYQRALLELVSRQVNADPSAGLPAASTPITGLSFPTAAAPVPVGKELVIGHVGITITRVISPADSYIGNAGFSSVAREGREYLVVDIKARCVSSSEACHLAEFDFGVEARSGRDYTAELSVNYSDLKGLFEGGEVEPGKSLGGSLIFIIQKGESGLRLIYPRMFNFGNSAEFLLGK